MVSISEVTMYMYSEHILKLQRNTTMGGFEFESKAYSVILRETLKWYCRNVYHVRVGEMPCPKNQRNSLPCTVRTSSQRSCRSKIHYD